MFLKTYHALAENLPNAVEEYLKGFSGFVVNSL